MRCGIQVGSLVMRCSLFTFARCFGRRLVSFQKDIFSSCLWKQSEVGSAGGFGRYLGIHASTTDAQSRIPAMKGYKRGPERKQLAQWD